MELLRELKEPSYSRSGNVKTEDDNAFRFIEAHQPVGRPMRLVDPLGPPVKAPRLVRP